MYSEFFSQWAPSGVCISWYLLRPVSGLCLCIQWPQREWSTRSFHVLEHVGFITVPPTPRSSAVASRTSGRTPCCCVIPIPCFFKCYGWLEPNSRQANKLMTQTWVHSEHTVQPGNLTLLPIHRTLIWLVWGVKAREDKKGVRVVLRGHVGKIW